MALPNFWSLLGLVFLSKTLNPSRIELGCMMRLDMAFLRSLKENSGWGDPTTFLIRRKRVEALVPDTGNRGLAIRHGDLNAWNLLADRNGLSGVIDWDTARFVPLPTAIQHPLFLADIPGWLNDVPKGMTFQDDRAYLERAVQGRVDNMNSPDAKCIPVLLSSSFERQFFEMALRNRAINVEYTTRRMSGVDLDQSVIFEQCKEILSRNPLARENTGVAKLCSRFDFEI
ncbi:hypothetical protein TOPH_02771 [Tolypocladium ophioglossoides CBS 100239]|uniref:Aminoglycoside phosphotransferase domain-containing protein n=1 Tax=Tolypocladium ophioglossoides (strain CBS 100239) TaxID=1163406 RepID=A0A0L0NES9_TOLOC|nr:hypothetical protein TOPH_02771 [Tolypocladium ophioglossoides CBS 100239]